MLCSETGVFSCVPADAILSLSQRRPLLLCAVKIVYEARAAFSTFQYLKVLYLLFSVKSSFFKNYNVAEVRYVLCVIISQHI